MNQESQGPIGSGSDQRPRHQYWPLRALIVPNPNSSWIRKSQASRYDADVFVWLLRRRKPEVIRARLEPRPTWRRRTANIIGQLRSRETWLREEFCLTPFHNSAAEECCRRGLALRTWYGLREACFVTPRGDMTLTQP